MVPIPHPLLPLLVFFPLSLPLRHAKLMHCLCSGSLRNITVLHTNKPAPLISALKRRAMFVNEQFDFSQTTTNSDIQH